MEINYLVKQKIMEDIRDGKPTSIIYSNAVLNGYKSKYKSFKNYLSDLRKEVTNFVSDIDNKPSKILLEKEDKLLKLLKNEKILDILDVCNLFSCPPKDIIEIVNKYKKSGNEIVIDNNKIFMSTKTIFKKNNKIEKLETDEIIFGVASDLHFGSKCCQITALNEFCETCRKKGVKYIFTPGDTFSGYNVYSGQVNDQYAINADEQLNSLINNLPGGFKWYILGGNHDYSFITKGGGYNILNVLESRRNDINYIGYDDADVPILTNVDLKMIHPSGGVPYSISYRLQKNIEQIAYSELSAVTFGSKNKPSVRFVLSGHLHIEMQAMFGNIFGIQSGCFEGQTNYLKRKGLFPSIGGWIIKASLGKNGILKDFETKFHIYEEIIDDWKNYKHSPEPKKVLTPIFEK